MEKYICVFGDSTAWGAWDIEKGGWVERLWLDLARGSESEDYFEIYNLSISGGTSQTVLDRFESEAKIRNATSIIVQTGCNDASHNSKGEFMVSIEKFRENIEEIIKRAKKIANEIILIGGKDVYEKLATPVPWADAYYRVENIHKYNGVMKEVCEKESILYMEMPDLMDSDFTDGVHPNAQGHEKIFVKVRSFLEENKWI